MVMNRESLENLSKPELITLLLQWEKSNKHLNCKVNRLERETINQRDEIRALKEYIESYKDARLWINNEYILSANIPSIKRVSGGN